jgi:hypothetical protein
MEPIGHAGWIGLLIALIIDEVYEPEGFSKSLFD